ncbi:CBS domain-containing protein [Pseudidiomarina terrestris]|uniref:CBS domain-containing protein n=1 Tax=Pseudidiomarina terrestris TaxID=2820060 RepID=A0AAW7QWS1_9GAMM|nr:MULTISPECIES: CBS domain-containing protein [unclassified Pseudidiomarina]MDN7124214.1 CBS domain-containing protein [Pseudidiomarina sp. 1APP75-32.1]MDN7127281.1 CBS domain-containing protein [Pseudidiomarina sp. 1APR75-33.1]MDN7128471.1 CBS domain-containing protein [Pseudidiomarina sp. 1APR75-15]MDN7135281.1 CBS domain-containing protein [Pseudidiomarina sp. 1ASP75-5]MDN7138660.1 CBS domain-containing protein [Pseudidiomarina sp. 1ASP75-14]
MQSMKVVEFMNRNPAVFTADMPIEAVVERLLKSRQRGGPVVDDERRVIGFISEQDCLAAMLRDTYHKEQSANVSDCMFSGEVLCVFAGDSITDVAQRMDLRKPKIYPVLDDDNRQLVGLITRTDVLAAIDGYFRDSYRRR